MKASEEKRNRDKKSEKILRDLEAAEEKYKIIFHLSPQAIGLMNTAGYITALNGRIYDIIQYRPEEVIGKHFLELPFFTEEGKRKLVENFARRLGGEEISPYDVDFISKSGERRVGTLVASLIRDSQGNPSESIVMFSDITLLKQTEQKLLALNKELKDTNLRLQRAYNWMRERRDHLREQLSQEEVGFLLDRDGRIEGVSEKVVECLEMQRSHLIGSLFTDLLDPEGLDLFRKELEPAWKGIANTITVALRVKQELKFYEMRMVRFTMESRRLLLAVLR